MIAQAHRLYIQSSPSRAIISLLLRPTVSKARGKARALTASLLLTASSLALTSIALAAPGDGPYSGAGSGVLAPPMELVLPNPSNPGQLVPPSSANPLPVTVQGSGGGNATVKIDQTTPGTTNGVQVVAPIPAGTNFIGDVGGKTTMVCTTPNVTTGNAYGTNFVVGGKLSFPNLFTATGTGILQDVVVTIKDLETSGFTFFPFNSDPSATTWTDAAVASINATDVPKVRGPVPLSSNVQLASANFSVQYAYGLGHAMAPGTTGLLGVLIANAALTTNFASTTDLQVCLKVLND